MMQDPKHLDIRPLSGSLSARGITTALLPILLICGLTCGLTFGAANIHAAQSIHLLGFVDTLCTDDPHCFVLMVKPEFHAVSPARIKVRFGAETRIFDPENYQLTLLQQIIVPGSHLRMLIEADDGGEANTYRASFIWIGD
jgi:hypothetical protein